MPLPSPSPSWSPLSSLSLSSPVAPSPSSSTSLPVALSPLTLLSSSPVTIGRDTSRLRHRPRVVRRHSRHRCHHRQLRRPSRCCHPCCHRRRRSSSLSVVVVVTCRHSVNHFSSSSPSLLYPVATLPIVPSPLLALSPSWSPLLLSSPVTTSPSSSTSLPVALLPRVSQSLG